MDEKPSRALNIVCLASYFKGVDFMRECNWQRLKRRQIRVLDLVIRRQTRPGVGDVHAEVREPVLEQSLLRTPGPDLFARDEEELVQLIW